MEGGGGSKCEIEKSSGTSQFVFEELLLRRAGRREPWEREVVITVVPELKGYVRNSETSCDN